MKSYFLSIIALLFFTTPVLSQDTVPVKHKTTKSRYQCTVSLAGKAGDIAVTKSEIRQAGNKLMLSCYTDSAKIISFVMHIVLNGSTYGIESKSNLFTDQMKDLISQTRKGSHFIIQDVRIKPPHSDSYVIPGLSIIITGE